MHRLVAILWASFRSMSPLGITGSTGQLGGRVARLLAEEGIEQRLVVRDASRAPKLGAEVAVAAYDDGDAVVAALSGVEVALMVSAAEEANRVRSHRIFVDAAAAAGVEHLVYISFYGASKDATFTLARDHWATEEYIKTSGMAWTFLRDNFYLDVLPYFVGKDGALRGPAGEGRFAGVARDDVADCAVAVLRDPAAHAGRTYSLTGPQALTMPEVAATITEVTGRPVRFENETVDEAYESRAVYSAADWQVDAWVTTYTAIAAGELAEVTDDVRTLSGHPPMTLAELLAR